MDTFSELQKHFQVLNILCLCMYEVYVHECILCRGTHVYEGTHVHVCMLAGGHQRSLQVSFLRAIRLGGFFLFLKIYMYELFTYMYVCAAYACLLLAEVRRH